MGDFERVFQHLDFKILKFRKNLYLYTMKFIAFIPLIGLIFLVCSYKPETYEWLADKLWVFVIWFLYQFSCLVTFGYLITL